MQKMQEHFLSCIAKAPTVGALIYTTLGVRELSSSLQHLNFIEY